MIIKLNPFSKLADKATIQSEFFQFGSCSVHFSVLFKQDSQTRVKFSQVSNCLKAFESLKDSQLCGVTLEMSLESEEFFENEEKVNQNCKKIEGKDIGIIIPVKHQLFDPVGIMDLTPGSYHSPCFPEVNQSPLDSPIESAKSGDLQAAESPLSVIRLPLGQSAWKGIKLPIRTEIGSQDSFQFIQKPDPKSEKPTKPAKIKEKLSKPSDFFMCSVCGKSIKKKSIKSHNTSKVHLMNLKMGN